MPPSQNPQSTPTTQHDPVAAAEPDIALPSDPIEASLVAESEETGIWVRIGAFILAAIPLTLLVVASRLEPNSNGLGTHQQLGLPPCSMRVIFGIRCPGCGMTTSWAHFTNGDWSSSMAVNPGGFLLAGFSLAFACIAMGTCWTGRYPGPNTQKALAASILAIAAITLVNWTVRLAS